jgi:cell fate (sporulation/competence/biofilm development) regulator YlbF (YheA/YmcA/DUF963 family)
METIKVARELGKAIQKDERYAAYHETKNKNDADEGLQALIGEFNLVRQKLGMESNKQGDVRDENLITSLNQEAQDAYTKIMDNENMKAFTAAKNAMDELIRDVSTIISLCCDGENPDTCDYNPQPPPVSGCASGGGCSGCGKH